MKKEIIVTAKTVEDARAKAAEELGVSAEELEITVLEEGKKGFLGFGASDAKISAVYTAKRADVALDFIRKIVADMELDLSVTLSDGDNDDKLISIDGENAGILIGHHGDTLDSLQYLANLAANKKQEGVKREYVKITVDVEGYRAKREMTLRNLARRMADKVLKYKKSVMLEPMNPYERRIIHSEIQHIEGVSTNSIGSENNRKIVIYLEEKQAKKGKSEEFASFSEEY